MMALADGNGVWTKAGMLCVYMDTLTELQGSQGSMMLSKFMSRADVWASGAHRNPFGYKTCRGRTSCLADKLDQTRANSVR